MRQSTVVLVIRKSLAVLAVLLCSMAGASAQVSVGVGVPGVSIGINLPVYPQLVPIPGYPVYYAPQVNSNYFFYDGMYWDFDQGNWYASAWYNGPWQVVSPDDVPVYLLRVPVRYYRSPPAYFRGWASNAPPRWGQHWGNRWAESHRGWDQWNRKSTPRPAPLPAYQRQYSGNRYPQGDQQRALQSRNYQYQPRDRAVQQHYRSQPTQAPREAVPGAGRPQRESRNVQPAVPPSSSAQRGPQAERGRGGAQGRGEAKGQQNGKPDQAQGKGGEGGRGKGGERGGDHNG
jgi:hypothetical protein